MNFIYIAGAHSRAATLGHYLTYLDSSVKIVAYLFDNDENNPTNIDGVPVLKINKGTVLNTEYVVYLATRGVNHPHLIETLSLCGMKTIIPVDVDLDLKIRNQFLRKYFLETNRDFLKLEDTNYTDSSVYLTNDISLYIIQSSQDKQYDTMYQNKHYEQILQAGSSISEKLVDAEHYDDIGDNISYRNTQFCELTGLYWIWKNAKESIIGLEHYRRRFILNEDWANSMVANDIDVILPTPLYVYPSIEGNYKARHNSSAWEYMLKILKENDPAEYEDAVSFFKDTALYSPCNMFIMRKNVLNDLCSWLFHILFSVVDYIGPIDDEYQNRYPGFLSERLITFFFDNNKDKYKVAYADKIFLG